MTSVFEEMCRNLKVSDDPRSELFYIPNINSTTTTPNLYMMSGKAHVNTGMRWQLSLDVESPRLTLVGSTSIGITGRVFHHLRKPHNLYSNDMGVHYYEDGLVSRSDGGPAIVSVDRPRLTWLQAGERHNTYGPSDFCVQTEESVNRFCQYHIHNKEMKKVDFEKNFMFSHLKIYEPMSEEDFMRLYKSELTTAFLSPTGTC